MVTKNPKKDKKMKKSRRKVRFNYYKNAKKNELFKNSNKLYECFKINYIFIIIVIFCIYALNYFNKEQYYYITSLSSFILAILIGWIVHFISHAFDFEELYDTTDIWIFKFFRSQPMLDITIRKIMLYTVDFHDKIHHDSKINKTPLNVINEIFQNILTQGGILILLSLMTHINMDRTAIMLWGLMYATVHNINYLLVGNSQHINHHIDPKTNYALDVFDIMFDTKYDLNNIENLNFNWGFNMIILTFLIIYFKLYI